MKTSKIMVDGYELTIFEEGDKVSAEILADGVEKRLSQTGESISTQALTRGRSACPADLPIAFEMELMLRAIKQYRGESE